MAHRWEVCGDRAGSQWRKRRDMIVGGVGVARQWGVERRAERCGREEVVEVLKVERGGP